MGLEEHFDRDLQRRPHGAAPADATAELARLIAEGRLRGDLSVTCRGRVDGAGQQAVAVFSAMMLARFAGCRYLHSPFVHMHHAEGSPQDWAVRWERFFNFADGEASVPEVAELVPLFDAIERPEAYADRPIVVFRPLFRLPDRATPAGEAVRREIRAKYWRAPKTAIRSHRGPTGFTVAVHLRRGDVTPTRHGYRYVPEDAVLLQIARVRKAIAPFGRPLTFNLYSEGNIQEFGAFADAGCNLHISEDPFEALHNMVTADILLSAPSNFSHIAALLSRGIVLHHRRRPPPFSGWLRRRPDSNIPIERLQHALLSQMGLLERSTLRARRWCYWATSSIRR